MFCKLFILAAVLAFAAASAQPGLIGAPIAATYASPALAYNTGFGYNAGLGYGYGYGLNRGFGYGYPYGYSRGFY